MKCLGVLLNCNINIYTLALHAMWFPTSKVSVSRKCGEKKALQNDCHVMQSLYVLANQSLKLVLVHTGM